MPGELNLRHLAETVIGRCRQLAGFTDAPGTIERTFLSPAMWDCMQMVQTWMEAAGMSVTTDAAGNLRGLYPGSTSARLVMGSHLDTVPDGGAFDGVLGVMIALSLVEALEEEVLPFSLEVIGFSEEEGVRYKSPFIGSRAVVGQLDEALLSVRDAEGVTVSDALISFGLKPQDLQGSVLDPGAAGFLEFHIEQGAVLEHENLSLGVVEAIAGQTRAEVVFSGEARHAGTTPMHLRRDALAGAAEWVSAVERFALTTPGLVATVGNVRVQPGAGNVVPGMVRATLDVRHRQDAVRHDAVGTLLQQANAIAGRRGLSLSSAIHMNQAAVPMDTRLSTLVEDAIRKAGSNPLRMVSGAGHDAMIVAGRVPTTMLFLRSPGGISHHPDESVRAEDVENALSAGLHFFRLFASHLQSQSYA
jgi:allantoate deiminase